VQVKPFRLEETALLNYVNFVRYFAIVLVVAVLIGAFVLIGIGCYYIWMAVFQIISHEPIEGSVSWAIGAKLAILKAIDSFVFSIVLIYISMGVYFLGASSEDQDPPRWLEIRSVADMERNVLSVIVVLVAILFLQGLVEQSPDLSWQLLLYPAGIVAIALALKLIPFDH